MSKPLFRNLAIADLFVCVTVQPRVVAYWISEVNGTWIICCYTGLTVIIAAVILCLASFLTVTAISVDRLLVFVVGVQIQRSCYSKESKYNSSRYIGLIHWRPIQLPLCCHNSVSLSITLFFSYTKIFLALRYYEIYVHSQRQPSQAIPLNIVRYRKGVYSALWVLVALIICYLPHYIAEVQSFWKIREVRQAVKATHRQLFCSCL